MRWTWAEVRRLEGWEIGRRHHDEHGDGFWLIRAAKTTTATTER